MLKLFILLLASLTLASCDSRREFKLLSVSDGDTIKVEELNCKDKCKVIKVRFLGIDAPELSQGTWGPKAKEHLIELINSDPGDSTVFLLADGETQDRYGRYLAYVFDDKDSLQSINELMLEHGYAVIYSYSAPLSQLQRFKSAELKARANNLNIWSLDNPLRLRPSEYRKKNKRKHS